MVAHVFFSYKLLRILNFLDRLYIDSIFKSISYLSRTVWWHLLNLCSRTIHCVTFSYLYHFITNTLVQAVKSKSLVYVFGGIRLNI